MAVQSPDRAGIRGHPFLPAWLPSLLCALFVGMLCVQEGLLLLELNGESQPLPSLTWRLLWPLGCLGAALLLPTRLRWHFLAFVGGLSSLVLASDRAYYEFFRSVPSLRAAVSARQLWGVRDSVAHLFSVPELTYPLFFALLALYGLVGQHVTRSHRFSDPLHSFAWTRRIAPVRCVGLALLGICVGLAHVARRTPVYEATHHLGRSEWVLPGEHWASQYSNASYAATFGVFNYHLSDLLSFARERTHRKDLSPTREAEILSLLTDKQRLNRQESPFRGLASGRSVVLIQMESWQHFVMDLRVGGVEVTPTLNRLKREGLSWDFIVDVTHLGRTSDAEFAVLTGLIPDTRGPAAFSGLEALPATLPRELAARGYRTASFHGYNRGFWNRAYTHPVLGIDAMFFEESFEGQPKLGLGTADPVVFDFVAGKLGEWSGPTLAFVVSLSSHHPYVYTPPEYDGLFADLAEDPSHGLLGPYLRSVRYADDALGAFVRALGERGLLERTAVVIYGDHDMGGIGARRPLEAVGPRLFTPLEDRVPLVVWIPGAEEFVVAHRSEFQGATGGLHDVFPTVLHLLGLEPPWGIEGTHLFVPDAARDPVPLPTPAGAFAFRQAIYGPFGAAPLGALPPPSHGVPTAERSLQDQLVVRDLLDLGATRILGSIPPGPKTASR